MLKVIDEDGAILYVDTVEIEGDTVSLTTELLSEIINPMIDTNNAYNKWYGAKRAKLEGNICNTHRGSRAFYLAKRNLIIFLGTMQPPRSSFIHTLLKMAGIECSEKPIDHETAIFTKRGGVLCQDIQEGKAG